MKRMLFILLMLILCQGLVGAQELPGDTQKAIEILPTVSVLPVGTLGKGAITIVEGTIDTKKYVVVHVLDGDVLTAMEKMKQSGQQSQETDQLIETSTQELEPEPAMSPSCQIML